MRPAGAAKMAAHVASDLKRGERFSSFNRDHFLSEAYPGRESATAQVATLATMAVDDAFWIRAESQLHGATETASRVCNEAMSVHGRVQGA